MKLISSGSSTPFVTGKWYYKKRLSRTEYSTVTRNSTYFPQVMQVRCDQHGNVHSVLTPSVSGELIVLERKINKAHYIFYEEFTPVTTENLKFEPGKRYQIANRGAIDSLYNVDLNIYGHNTSLRRFLSEGSRRMRGRNQIYINKVYKSGILNIFGSGARPEQYAFTVKIPGWLLMFLEEVGTKKEPIEKDPVETFVSKHENLEENTRRQIIQSEPVDLPSMETELTVTDEDLELLTAVKFLISQRDIKYGSRANLRIDADGYNYPVDNTDFLVKWANKRKEELIQYRKEVNEQIESLKTLSDTLPE